MRLFHVTVAVAAFAAAFSAHGAQPAGSPPPSSQPDGQTLGKPTDSASDLNAMLRFAPMWMPVPRFPRDPNAESTGAAAAYAMIWQPQWQKEIGLSAEQKTALLAINAKAVADAKQQTEHFKSLPPEEQKARAKSWGGKPSPWRQQFEIEFRKQIEGVLTPRQLQTLRDFSFPEQAFGLMCDAKVRREIGFSPQQEDRLRRIIREKLARSQQESLKRAEKVWGLLSPRQQAELSEVVKHQGPTSAALSIAWELGFDMDAMGLSYPMLAESPVRERLRLNAEQQKQLQAVMADSAARSRKARQGAPQPDPEADDKRRVEAILTPQQLTTLAEINFRRQVVLALGYPKKRESIGMTDQQKADLQRLDKDTHEQLYGIYRESLGKMLEILTPPQREQLSAEIDRRFFGG